MFISAQRRQAICFPWQSQVDSSWGFSLLFFQPCICLSESQSLLSYRWNFNRLSDFSKSKNPPCKVHKSKLYVQNGINQNRPKFQQLSFCPRQNFVHTSALTDSSLTRQSNSAIFRNNLSQARKMWHWKEIRTNHGSVVFTFWIWFGERINGTAPKGQMLCILPASIFWPQSLKIDTVAFCASVFCSSIDWLWNM